MGSAEVIRPSAGGLGGIPQFSFTPPGLGETEGVEEEIVIAPRLEILRNYLGFRKGRE